MQMILVQMNSWQLVNQIAVHSGHMFIKKILRLVLHQKTNNHDSIIKKPILIDVFAFSTYVTDLFSSCIWFVLPVLHSVWLEMCEESNEKLETIESVWWQSQFLACINSLTALHEQGSVK